MTHFDFHSRNRICGTAEASVAKLGIQEEYIKC